VNAVPESIASASRTVPAGRAAVTALRLTNFRNYESLALALDGRSVVLVGQNGAGKTNLLEAISFLSPGRGLRRAELPEVARRDGDGTWAVAATVVNGAGPAEIGTGIALGPAGPESQRRVRINHAAARASEALLEYLRVAWLTPSMDGLFTGPASDRRRFIDRAVLAIDPGHATRFNAFERAMRGRNRLLAEGSTDGTWLNAIEREMAELAVAIAAARREWASLTAALIGEGGEEPFPKAEIALAGTLEAELAGQANGVAVEDDYRRTLAAGRARDAAAGRTLAGPHLSDLRVRHAAKQAPADSCSTGEQKALLIGLVLAQARLVRQVTGEAPVLLLDEVAAHLDAGRREALFGVLHDLGAQTFMTGTDASVFAPLGDRAEVLPVSDGHIQPL